MKNLKKILGPYVCLLLLSLLLAAPALTRRLSLEKSAHSSLILFDLREFSSLRTQSARQDFAALMEAGISSFLAPEYRAEEIKNGMLEGVEILPCAELPEAVRGQFSAGVGTVVALRGPEPELVQAQADYVSRRFEAKESVLSQGVTYLRIPRSYEEIREAGVLPDLRSMDYLASLGVPLVYAPSPSYGGTIGGLLDSLRFLCARYSNLKALCPAGEITTAYPHLKELGDFVKSRDLLMAQVEFSVQYGSGLQNWEAWPNVVSLHSVDRREVIKRGIIRPIMLNRLYRAASERSVRLLVLRQDPLRSIPASLAEYCADVRSLRARLDAAGFGRLWPSAAPDYSGSALAGIGLALLMLTLAVRYGERFFALSILSERKYLIGLCAAAAALGILSLRVGLALRVTGALAAGLLATEASLHAMDRWKVPLRGVAEVLVLVVMGGLVIEGCFSSPLYMYRMNSFSGVKLSLLLPLLLVLVMDFRRKEHPESLMEILVRPPLWGELALAGGLILAALVVLLRSGNYGFVSNSEILFRDWLEEIFKARPRTKEFLVGYPALVIWYYLKRADLLGRWREVLRLTVTLAFSSAVNSFCHFHTPLSLSILRGFNGWWSGLLLGVLLLVLGIRVGKTLYRKITEIL